MGKKQVVSIRMAPRVHRQLRLIGLQWDMSIGDVIEGLLKTVHDCQALVDNPEWRKLFEAIYETAMINAGISGAIVGSNEDKKMTEKQRRRLEAYAQFKAAQEGSPEGGR